MAGNAHPQADAHAGLPVRAVVTGGAGFIGSHLADRLVELGYHVTVLDDLSTGRVENIAHLEGHPLFRFVQGSILDRDLLAELFQGVTYVFHEAAIPSVQRSIEDPASSHLVNSTGTVLVLMAARDAGVRHLVYASSSSVYGDTPTLPKHEDMTPRPLSPYAVSKLSAEMSCGAFSMSFGLPTTSLRYFNVYGPRQNPDSQYSAVIPKFIRAAKRGEPLTIYGDGKQTRDFTYVADVVDANVFAATHGLTGVFNVGRGDTITIESLISVVRQATGSQSAVMHQPPRSGDIYASQADPSRLALAGFTLGTTLKQGIERTIASVQ
ncbi:MAG: SDR family oxidoreductase [Dehalococcoidia bacterium]|nr:SDR family oxidoreductase [Dehalococcoidia bacterium]